MSTTPLHVVLGAGPAGTATVTELRRRGLRTRHVSRSPVVVEDPAVETVVADVSDPEAAISATDGAATIYHAVNVPYHRQIAEMPVIADAIIGAAAHHDATLVVLDTLYPYGTAEGDRITESTPWAATTRKGRMRADLDRRYLGEHERGRIRVGLGRSADFFGPGVWSSTLGAGFFPQALTGEPVVAFGDIDLPHSYSYVPDVAAGLVTLGTDSRALGRVWHLPTVPAVSTAEVHRRVGSMLGRSLEALVLDEPQPIGGFDEQFMAEYAEMFYQHRIPQNMVSTAFETTFGVAPTPLDEALSTTLRWFSQMTPAVGVQEVSNR
ncbi:NAD-dependent epimerase/dehydratase family protein [uncultured Williamsia sp.]|uniref:NAD-dependent epimerase/dehydratase family protein n=1 Tax=uncultured Williamsia sp. TaxID=259311 RepID=UPI00260851A2|nr:NAD-dependent epimerase/dehydratase family protein [uncultured Williamsia sp.]